jgi:hypothetical protein
VKKRLACADGYPAPAAEIWVCPPHPEKNRREAAIRRFSTPLSVRIRP